MLDTQLRGKVNPISPGRCHKWLLLSEIPDKWPGGLARHLLHGTTCNTTSIVKSKMATRGIQKGWQSLERGLILRFWVLRSIFAKLILFLLSTPSMRNSKSKMAARGSQICRWGLIRGLLKDGCSHQLSKNKFFYLSTPSMRKVDGGEKKYDV